MNDRKGALSEEHEHEWQPNGTVEVDRMQKSPVSVYDDALWTDVLSVAICRCGQTKKTLVGRKNMRRRGDAIRRERGPVQR